MPTGRLVKWFCETWVTEFWIFHQVPGKSVDDYCTRHGKPSPRLGEVTKEGSTVFRLDNTGPIIIWTKPMKNRVTQIEILAHECLHAANVCLKRRGWDPDLDNDEPQTYLVQRIIAKALGA